MEEYINLRKEDIQVLFLKWMVFIMEFHRIINKRSNNVWWKKF